MSDIINQNTEPIFIFDMPDDETLSETISVKGEKGERGDPTKLSDLTNDTGFITKNVSDLTNYYTKTATDALLDGKVDTTTLDDYDTSEDVDGKISDALDDYYTKTATDGLIDALNVPDGFFSGGDTATGAGSSFTIDNTTKATLQNVILYGDTEQDGAPTPSSQKNVVVVTGEQTVTIYSGSDSQSYKVNLGKNLFNKNSFSSFNDHFIGGGGTIKASSGSSIGNDFIAIIEIEPNTTYTVSKPTQASANRLRVGISDALIAENYVFGIWGGGDDATEVTLTSSANSRYMYIYYAGNLLNKQVALESLQVEKSSSATEYAEYFEPIKLHKIGDYRDFIYKSGDSWYVRKAVGKVEIESPVWHGISTSAAEIETVSSDGSFCLFWYENGVSSLSGELLSNYMKWQEQIISGNSGSRSMADKTFIQRSGTNDRLYFRDTTLIGKTGAQLGAMTPNLVLYYALATPFDEEITNKALIEQLEELAMASSYEGSTSIAASGILPAILTVVAYKDNWSGTVSGLHNSIATRANLGLVKIGAGLSINADGILSIEDADDDDGIPSYFESQLTTAVASIKSNMASVGRRGDTFIFITDTHWDRNAGHSPQLIKYILDNTNIANVVHGGDFFTSETTKDDAISRLTEAHDVYSNITDKVFTVFGNHDTNKIDYPSDSSKWIQPNEIYNILYKKQEPYVTSWNNEQVDQNNVDAQYYYYVDNNATMTRYVFLSTSLGTMGSTQLSWLSTLLTNSSGWNVVIFAHWINHGSSETPTSSYSADGTSLKTLCDSHTDKVKAIISGHIHFDFVDHTAGGIPIIFTTTDALRVSQYSTDKIIRGTISEQAFDVITVDYDTGDVKCVRIGRGQNRTIQSQV